jgi:hypothetical protein
MKPVRLYAILVAAACLLGPAVHTAAAQGRGGFGGRGDSFPLSRMEMLTENFKLEGENKKQVKAVLDAAHKSAEPVRAALLSTHAALGAAVQAGKSAAEIDAAAKAYAEQVSAMSRIEMEAIAKVLSIADPELKNTAAVQSAFYMARGMFLKKGKWDEIPDRNVPSY